MKFNAHLVKSDRAGVDTEVGSGGSKYTTPVRLSNPSILPAYLNAPESSNFYALSPPCLKRLIRVACRGYRQAQVRISSRPQYHVITLLEVQEAIFKRIIINDRLYSSQTVLYDLKGSRVQQLVKHHRVHVIRPGTCTFQHSVFRLGAVTTASR